MPKKVRIILDTNIFVSYFFGSVFKQKVDRILEDQTFTLLRSEELLAEIKRVLVRDKFKDRISPEDVELLLTTIVLRSENVDVLSSFDLVRDKGDNFLINLSFDGKADYLLAGDNGLLVLGTAFETEILNLNSFYWKFYVS